VRLFPRWIPLGLNRTQHVSEVRAYTPIEQRSSFGLLYEIWRLRPRTNNCYVGGELYEREDW
jgi:hypothetical protein